MPPILETLEPAIESPAGQRRRKSFATATATSASTTIAVLLTRGRDGTVIVVPPLGAMDATCDASVMAGMIPLARSTDLFQAVGV